MFKFGKLVGVLSLTTLLIGATALPSFATNLSIPGTQETQKTSIKLTDQQKKDLLSKINNDTKFAQKYGKINVSTATNAELEEYGIPDRPTDPQILKQWNQIYGNVKEVVKPQFAVSDVYHITWTETSISGNWSGGINRDNGLKVGYNSSGYQGANGKFTIPDLSQHTQLSGQTSFDSFWVGLGGDDGTPSDSLIQDGVSAYTVNGTSFSYFPWWEDYSLIPGNHYYESPAVMITNLSVNPNDVIYVGTGLNSDGSQMLFSITDWTTGQTTGNFSEPTYGAVNNDSAEWITEAPSNGSTRYPLANYGTENWLGSYTYGTYSSNQVESGMVVNPLGINPVTIGTIMESNNILESDTSEPTATNTFTNTWDNY